MNEFSGVLSSASPHHCLWWGPLQVQHTVTGFQGFFSFRKRGFLETEHEARFYELTREMAEKKLEWFGWVGDHVGGLLEQTLLHSSCASPVN